VAERSDEMDPQRPLTNFLSWLIEEPERLERYQTAEGFQGLLEDQGLSYELQKILRDNDLRSAMEVLKEETGGDNVMFFVIMHFVI
jgi:hypothetical protein